MSQKTSVNCELDLIELARKPKLYRSVGVLKDGVKRNVVIMNDNPGNVTYELSRTGSFVPRMMNPNRFNFFFCNYLNAVPRLTPEWISTYAPYYGEARTGDSVKEVRLDLRIDIVEMTPTLYNGDQQYFQKYRIVLIRENSNTRSIGLTSVNDRPQFTEVFDYAQIQNGTTFPNDQYYGSAFFNWNNRKRFTVLYDRLHNPEIFLTAQGVSSAPAVQHPLVGSASTNVAISLDIDRTLYFRRRSEGEATNPFAPLYLDSGGIFLYVIPFFEEYGWIRDTYPDIRLTSAIYFEDV